MKKTLLAFLAVCLFSGAALSGEKTILRMSWWGGNDRHEATLAALRAFEAANPDIEIKAEYMGWNGYLERLTTQIGAGSEADVMQIDWAWLAMFSKNGDGFYDIYQLKDSIDLAEFDQQWLDSGTVKGKLNALPVSFTALIVMWNETTWAKSGLEYPKTWEEFVAVGKPFHEKLGDKYYPFDMNWNEIVYLTHAYIFQKTGKQFIWPDKPEVALTKEELMDWLGYYKRLVDSGTLMSLQNRTAIGGDSERQSQECKEFIDGEWAGTSTFDSAIANRLGTMREDQKFVIGDFLTEPDAKSSGRVGRPSMLFAVSKNSKNPELAAKLIEFLLASKEGTSILKSTRGAFVTKTGYQTLVDMNLITEINQAAINQIRQTQCHTPNPYFEHARTKELMRTAFEGVGYGKLTLEEGADMLLKDGNRIVKRLAR